MMMTEIEIVDEKFLKEMIIKLLSFMNDNQLKQVEDWLEEMNLKLEDLEGLK